MGQTQRQEDHAQLTKAVSPGQNANMAQLSQSQRRHDLDALRAVAMLMGIVLHTAGLFVRETD